MDLFEYQARDVLASHGVPVLPGGVAETPEQAEAVAREIAGPVVVKAQVKTGGRGKAGGVKLADDPDAAKARAQDILGLDIKGHITHRVLVAQASDIAEEYYFSYLLDRSNRTFLAMASVEGGMDIEEVAATKPEALARIPVDATTGVDTAKATEIVDAAKFPAAVRDQVIAIAVQLWEVFQKEDATLVEVNPLAKTPDGTVLALDAKVTLDDNAAFRHPQHAELEDSRLGRPARGGGQGEGPQLRQARRRGRHHRQRRRPGHEHAGRRRLRRRGVRRGPAGQLPRHRRWRLGQVMADGLHIILGDPAVKSVFVNVFGGITACDAVANGIVSALHMLGDEATKPLVVRLDGNNVEEGRRILAEANHPLVTVVDTMDGAARRAAELAAA